MHRLPSQHGKQGPRDHTTSMAMLLAVVENGNDLTLRQALAVTVALTSFLERHFFAISNSLSLLPVYLHSKLTLY